MGTKALGWGGPSLASPSPAPAPAPASHPSPLPLPGRVYIIRHSRTDRFLCVTRGELKIVSNFNRDDQFHGGRWYCTENHGWLQFQEAVSGNYLHKDPCYVISSSASSALQNRWFQIMRYERDGSCMRLGGEENQLVALMDGSRQGRSCLRRSGLNDYDCFFTVESGDQATAWDFTEV